MLNIPNEDVKAYLAEVRAEASRLGIIDRLEKRLKYLDEYGWSLKNPDHMRCTIHKDFSPLSFNLMMEVKQSDGSYKFLWAGALIYHGPHDGCGSGSAPTFAVTLEAVDKDWSIHT
jgi:hypothetical protein